MASSIFEMVAFRVAQGVFGASLVPISQAALLDAFPREKHGSAMALWGVGVMVGPILGPPLGGWLTENYSWHWVFLINLPIGALALLGVLASVSRERQAGALFDWRGFALLGIGIGALQLMLDRGQQQDWLQSPEIWIELIACGLGLYLFVVHMTTTEHPYLPPRLFTDRNFVTGLFFIFVIGIILLATMALLPPMLQQLMGYPSITTGLVLAPRDGSPGVTLAGHRLTVYRQLADGHWRLARVAHTLAPVSDAG